MKLSPNFRLSEFTSSQICERKGWDNTAPPEVLENLKFLAQELEYVRDILGHPMYISSGFRCDLLNNYLGSKPTSSHRQGLAVDFHCYGFGDPHSIVSAIVMAKVNYDQIILEHYDREKQTGWVHLSFKQLDPRNQALIIDKKGARPFEDTTT